MPEVNENRLHEVFSDAGLVRRMHKLAEEVILCRRNGDDKGCMDAAIGLARKFLDVRATLKHSEHLTYHRWPFKDMVVNQTVEVPEADIVNVRNALQRVRKAYGYQYATSLHPAGFYVIRRTA